MATVAQRTQAAREQAAREARKAAATVLLREIKLVFDDRPAVYQEIVINLNQLPIKTADTVGCLARVEALLATAPRADILARFRDFMPAAAQARSDSFANGRNASLRRCCAILPHGGAGK